jgi:sterol desaturase/sphingolipid hydroxylase (fatty acid hydroxylase superfamily)
MPLHTLGLSSVKRSYHGFTKDDLLSIIICTLFFTLPGVDHRSLWQWVIDHVFMGSIAAASVFGIFVFHKSTEWGGMIFYTLLYVWESRPALPGASRIRDARVDSQKRVWGWSDPDEKLAKKTMDLQKKSLVYIITFHACVTVFQFMLAASLIQLSWDGSTTFGFRWEWIKGDPELTKADPLTIPEKSTIAYQCLMSTLIAETGFYWFHRLLHETRLYYWHKRHHEFNDDNNLTVYSAFYVGFLDATLTDFFWAGFGIFYYQMHVYTAVLYTLPLIFNAMRVHCGYINSSFIGVDPLATIPLSTDVERTHALHHRYNTCNYGGALFLWDRIMGTFKCPDTDAEEMDEEVRRKKEKNQMKIQQQGDVIPVSHEEVEVARAETKGSKKSKMNQEKKTKAS